MSAKKIIALQERIEKCIYEFLARALLAVKRIKPFGNIWSKGIKDSELMRASGRCDLRQQVMQKFLVALSIEDD